MPLGILNTNLASGLEFCTGPWSERRKGNRSLPFLFIDIFYNKKTKKAVMESI